MLHEARLKTRRHGRAAEVIDEGGALTRTRSRPRHQQRVNRGNPITCNSQRQKTINVRRVMASFVSGSGESALASVRRRKLFHLLFTFQSIRSREAPPADYCRGVFPGMMRLKGGASNPMLQGSRAAGDSAYSYTCDTQSTNPLRQSVHSYVPGASDETGGDPHPDPLRPASRPSDHED